MSNTNFNFKGGNMAKAINKILSSWVDLNNFIRSCDQQAAEKLLAEELAGKKRKQFALRIHSRINKVRADKERIEILRKIK
jgi:hypothetical protein